MSLRYSPNSVEIQRTEQKYLSLAVKCEVTKLNASYEVYLRAKFTSTFNKIQNCQFWKSSGGPDAGISIKWDGDGNTAYATPVSSNSTIATAAVPTGDPGTANVSIAGQLTGSLSSSGFSDYLVLQIQSTTAAAAGDSSTYVYTIQYDEN